MGNGSLPIEELATIKQKDIHRVSTVNKSNQYDCAIDTLDSNYTKSRQAPLEIQPFSQGYWHMSYLPR